MLLPMSATVSVRIGLWGVCPQEWTDQGMKLNMHLYFALVKNTWSYTFIPQNIMVLH